MLLLSLHILLCFIVFVGKFRSTAQENEETIPDPEPQYEWDPKGYVIFCLCMGKCLHSMDLSSNGHS